MGIVGTIESQTLGWPFRGFVSDLQNYSTDYIIALILGLVIALGVPMLRRRLRWLRISVAAIALGLTFSPYLWAPILAAFIIKYIILRVGGVRTYENVLRPLAVGAIAGYMLMYFIMSPIMQRVVHFWFVDLPRALEQLGV